MFNASQKAVCFDRVTLAYGKYVSPPPPLPAIWPPGPLLGIPERNQVSLVPHNLRKENNIRHDRALPHKTDANIQTW